MIAASPTMDSLSKEPRTMSSPTAKPYRRVAVFVGTTEHVVGGYCPGGYVPEGTFGSVHAALDHALSLPVTDPAQPIHVLRLEVTA